MTDTTLLGPWLKRFLGEYLVSERNLARNTQLGYRDTLVQLLPFVAARARQPLERLAVADLTADRVRAFLAHVEESRGCLPQTRNQRLSAIRAADECVFLSRQGRPFTRFGIRALVGRCAARAVGQAPSLASKVVGPHVIRHTAATHLLRSGVDINTIRAWLGHANLSTTNIYAEIDVETKAKAIACCDESETAPTERWRDRKDLMQYLRTL